jgi:hypothetical protein
MACYGDSITFFYFISISYFSFRNSQIFNIQCLGKKIFLFSTTFVLAMAKPDGLVCEGNPLQLVLKLNLCETIPQIPPQSS